MALDIDAVHVRLAKAQGQIAAVDRMISSGDSTERILVQINAAKSALHKVALLVAEEAVAEIVVVHAVANGIGRRVRGHGVGHVAPVHAHEALVDLDVEVVVLEPLHEPVACRRPLDLDRLIGVMGTVIRPFLEAQPELSLPLVSGEVPAEIVSEPLVDERPDL